MESFGAGEVQSVSDPVPAAAEHRSVCRICTAQCGLLVAVADSRIAGVRGDAEHPASHGYTCPKGRALADFHHGPRRLTRPRLRGKDVSWPAVLDDLAAAFADVRARQGTDAVGVYSSMGAAFESAGLLVQHRLFGALNVRQRYSALMYDCGPLLRAAEMVGGAAWELNPSWVPEADSPRFVLFIGCNPVVSHGYQTNLPEPRARMRAFQRRGGRIWVLDARRTETADLADRALIVRPGSDAYVLAYLTAQLLTEGYDAHELAAYCRADELDRLRAALAPFDAELAARASGLPAAELRALADAVRNAGQPAILTGTGVQFGPHALVAEWLRLVILVVTGSIDRAGGMWVPPGWIIPFDRRTSRSYGSAEGDDGPGPESRPDLRQLLGEYPAVAMADQIEQGYLRGLFIAGGNPLTAGPEPDRLRAAIAELDFLAVTDVADNEVTALATHVLPVPAMLERSDVVRNKSHTCYAPAVIPPPAGTRPAWWVWAQLAGRLGVEVLGGVPVDECSDELLNRQLLAHSRGGADALIAAGPHGLGMPREPGWFHDALPEGRWRLAPRELLGRLGRLADCADPPDALIFVSRRVISAHNSVRYARDQRGNSAARAGLEVGDAAAVSVHPDDAAARGISDGAAVTVRSRSGSVVATARVDERAARGTVSLTHGSRTPNAAALIDPRVDPLTGQPVFSGFPVEVDVVTPSPGQSRRLADASASSS